GNTRKADKSQFFPVNMFHFPLFSSNKYHAPCHNKHYSSTDGSPQIRLYTGNPDFSKDSSQAGKKSRTSCVKHPAGFPFLFLLFDIFLFNHQENPCSDRQNCQQFRKTYTFPQKNQSKQNRQYRT